MSEIIIIIGLPGSGKTHYIHNVLSQGKQLKNFDDWGRKKTGDYFFGIPNPEVRFIDDDRYGDLIEEIKNKRKIIVSGGEFCDHDFLCKSEYYLKSQFPNLKIRRIYFENNIEKSISNIIYRDKEQGGRFKMDEKGNKWYVGDHFGKEIAYRVIIKASKRLSKEYVIPSEYFPIPIFVTKNYKLSDYDF